MWSRISRLFHRKSEASPSPCPSHGNLGPRGRDSRLTATTLTKRDYSKLLADLRRIIREGKEEAERIVIFYRTYKRSRASKA